MRRCFRLGDGPSVSGGPFPSPDERFDSIAASSIGAENNAKREAVKSFLVPLAE